MSEAIRPAANPPVLPASITSRFSLQFHDGPADAGLLAGILLPDDLARAVPVRQLHFRAGRFCAREALRQLDPHLPFGIVSRDAGGAPVWPAGTTGSITHTDGFASAAVARTRDAASVGIDAERIVSAARAREIATLVAWPSELALAKAAGLDRLQAMTLVFSAKETFFKCVYPLVRRMCGFHDVRLVDVDARTGRFRLCVVRTLSESLAAGTAVRGRFFLDEPWVHTGMLLAAVTASPEGASVATISDRFSAMRAAAQGV